MTTKPVQNKPVASNLALIETDPDLAAVWRQVIAHGFSPHGFLPSITLYPSLSQALEAFKTSDKTDWPAVIVLDPSQHSQASLKHLSQSTSSRLVFFHQQATPALIEQAHALCVGNLLPKQYPVCLDRLQQQWCFLSRLRPSSVPDLEGLKAFFSSDCLHSAQFWQLTLKQSDDYEHAVSQIRETLNRLSLDIDTTLMLELAIIEALTNALYHAYKLPNGRPKYKKPGHETFDIVQQAKPVQLEPEEYIELAIVADDEKFGLSITDRAGSLKAKQVLRWLHKNTRPLPSFEAHGRGFFLLYTLCDQLAITIVPGRKTELLLLKYFNTPAFYKPALFLNELDC